MKLDILNIKVIRESEIVNSFKTRKILEYEVGILYMIAMFVGKKKFFFLLNV